MDLIPQEGEFSQGYGGFQVPLGVWVPGALVQPRVGVFAGDKVWARILECAEERKQFIDDGKE